MSQDKLQIKQDFRDEISKEINEFQKEYKHVIAPVIEKIVKCNDTKIQLKMFGYLASVIETAQRDKDILIKSITK